MGHHSKKNNQSPPPQAFDLNTMGQLMNNIDLQAMSNMLNGIDINQIMSMMSKGSQPNPAQPASATAKAAPDIRASSAASQPSPPLFNFQAPPQQPASNFDLPPNDPIVLILNSIKPFLPQDKVRIMDDMVKLLGIKLVIDAVFPPAPSQNTASAGKKTSDESVEEDKNEEEEIPEEKDGSNIN